MSLSMGVATQPSVTPVRPRSVLLVGPLVAGWSVGRDNPTPDAFVRHPPDPVPLELVETPAAVVSLMSLGGASFALADHYNHIHIGY
jgi:hypothetical protein